MTRSSVFLSDTVVLNARPRAREFAIPDNRIAGFFLRVQPSGAKSWVLRAADVARKNRRITLGSAAVMGAEEARARAHEALLDLAPEAARLAEIASQSMTFAELAEEFLKARRREYRPSTLRALNVYLNAVLLPAFGERPINRISTAEIAEWFHDYSSGRPGGANQAMTHFRTIMRFSRDTGRLPRNAPDPSKPIRRNTRRARGRLLNSEQLSKLGAWLAELPPHWADVADAIHLIVLTGCRAGEIRNLLWTEVGADRLRLTSTKTGPRDVLISKAAVVILKKRTRASSSRFVFPDLKAPERPIGEIHNPWRRIRALIGLPPDIRLHDLRHTYASHAIMSGETLDMAGQLLGHRRTQSTEIYAHLDAGHLIGAADRVANIIAAHIE